MADFGKVSPVSSIPADCDVCYCSVYLFASVLGIFLWPLVSTHELGLWLEPVLQKLNFGVGHFLQKIKENHGNQVCSI